jgi:hypothetical protein
MRKRRQTRAPDKLDGQQLLFEHVHLHGGRAPVRRHLPELIDLVVNEKINLDKSSTLAAYAQRTPIGDSYGVLGVLYSTSFWNGFHTVS